MIVVTKLFLVSEPANRASGSETRVYIRKKRVKLEALGKDSGKGIDTHKVSFGNFDSFDHFVEQCYRNCDSLDHFEEQGYGNFMGVSFSLVRFELNLTQPFEFEVS